ncbi:MAG: hypothetical protein KGN16_08940 [Burkholderiales bacterium]|nr:hypothetical protein [Burkholderiales bacterium]
MKMRPSEGRPGHALRRVLVIGLLLAASAVVHRGTASRPDKAVPDPGRFAHAVPRPAHAEHVESPAAANGAIAARPGVARSDGLADSSVRESGEAPVWDLCGVGKMPVPPDLAASASPMGVELPPNLGEQALAAALERLLAAMDVGSPRSRAAAMLMHPMIVPAPADAPSPQAGAQQLASLAAGSGDPVLLAWAARHCDVNTACATDPAIAWSRIEPDNAVPWLLIAAHQPGMQAEALTALARATRYTSHYGAISAAALDAMPADIPTYLQPQLLLQSFLADGAIGEAEATQAINLCRPAPEAGSQRQALCRSLAALMVGQDDTALAYFIGLRIQELAGVPDVHHNERRAAMQRLLGNFGMAVFDWERPYACTTVERWHRWTRDRATLGELGAARAWAAAAASAASAAVR